MHSGRRFGARYADGRLSRPPRSRSLQNGLPRSPLLRIAALLDPPFPHHRDSRSNHNHYTTSRAAACGRGHIHRFLHHARGSDFDRPGLVPRANLNIGIGHTFKFLHKDPIGDELTFTYTYENAGSHGFFHTNFGSHTEALGIMKNFNLPKTKVVTGYTWIQAGLTSFTGNSHVENRFYDGEALGLAIHFNDHNGIWIQESYNKIPTVPWYTTTGIGYTWSW